MTTPEHHATAKDSFQKTFQSFIQPKMAMMLALGFASGLPLMMVFSKLSAWLREAGVDRTTIGFFYWVGLAYSIKFLWAPIVDRGKIPIITKQLGQRRSWMITAMCGTAIGLSTIAFSDPSQGLWMTLAGAFILAYSGATLDISIDAWRIESAPNEEQASMAATYNLGYRFAIMFAGVGLIIADHSSWTVSYLVMASAMILSSVLVFMIPEPSHAARKISNARSLAAKATEAVVEPFYQVIQRLQFWTLPVLALVAVYRLSDFTMGVMASPFYIDLHYSKTVIGSIQSLMPWMIIVGGFVGGFFVGMFGLLRTMLIGAVITFITNGAFAWLALHPVAMGLPCTGLEAEALLTCRADISVSSSEVARLAFVIGSDNFAAGFVGTAFIAYMSSLTDRANAATQYALFSSAYAFFCKLIAGFSGVLSDAVGWFWFFVITALYTIPAALLILVIQFFGSNAAKGIKEEEVTEDAPV